MKNELLYFVIFAIIILIISLISLQASRSIGPVEIASESFAKCLSEKGVKMYGASWCPHCQNQKKMFGEYWNYIDYIECSTAGGFGEASACIDANITGYPTWVFQNGVRKVGELSLDELSRLSGCNTS